MDLLREGPVFSPFAGTNMDMHPQSPVRDLKPHNLKEQNLPIFGNMSLASRGASAHMDERVYLKYGNLSETLTSTVLYHRFTIWTTGTYKSMVHLWAEIPE